MIQDELFETAGRFIIEQEKASIGNLQRHLRIGFNRAARIMDQLYAAGVVSKDEGTKPRKVLMKAEEFEEYLPEQVTTRTREDTFMKTDIQIAQEAQMMPIREVTAGFGITDG